MKKLLLLLLIPVLFYSCQPNNDELLKRIDSMQFTIDSLNQVVQLKDSVIATPTVQNRMLSQNATSADSILILQGDIVLMPEIFAQGLVIGYGTVSTTNKGGGTLSQAGFTAGAASAAWPRTTKRYGTAINVSTMTMDWICWQEMVYLMEDYGSSYCQSPGGKVYYLSNSLKLPLQKNPPANKRRALQQYIFDLKGSCLENRTTTSFPLIDRYPKDQTEANAFLNTQYVLRDFFIVGNGSTDALNVGIRIAATTKSIFENGKVDKCNVGIQSEFMLFATYRGLNFSSYRKYGLSHTNGTYPGAGVANAMGNMAIMENNRWYNSPGYTPIAGLYISNSHNISGNLFTFEGDKGSQSLIFCNMTGGAGVNVFELSNIYMEFAGCTRAGIHIKGGKGQFILNQLRSSIVETDMPILVDVEAIQVDGNWGALHVMLNNSAGSDRNKGKFRNSGSASYGVKWYVTNYNMKNNTTFNSVENFDTSTPGSYLPKSTDCRFTKPL